jgi:hypothetical protein
MEHKIAKSLGKVKAGRDFIVTDGSDYRPGGRSQYIDELGNLLDF